MNSLWIEPPFPHCRIPLSRVSPVPATGVDCMSFCRISRTEFAFLYLLALLLLLVGTFDLFGQERNPLSGVFVLLLGMPWNHLLDFLPDTARAWAAAAAPIVNLILLRLICWVLTRPGAVS